jgi:serine/threonine-protein kinase
VRSILGAEAEAAQAFKPPPPELDEEDLRLLDDLDTAQAPPSTISLRELGDSEPGAAPRNVPPPRPRAAQVMPPVLPAPSRVAGRRVDDDAWLIRFTLAISLIGLLAIVLIALLR